MTYWDLMKIAGNSEIRTSVEYYIENSGIEQMRREVRFPYKWTNFTESFYMSVREVPTESLLPKSPADALEFFLNIQDSFPPTQTFRYEDFLDELMDLEEDDEAKEQLAAQTRYANVLVHVEALGEYEQKYRDNGEEVFPLEPVDCFDSYQEYLDAFRHLGDYQYIYENGIGHVTWREPDGREAYEEIE